MIRAAVLSLLRNRTYRRLFTAQVIALVGTGLATVALGLLAYDIAAGDAGAVLGTALALKMVAYVTFAPVAGVVAARVPHRTLLVGADLTRGGVALLLPFVDQVWQVYVLIFVLQAASATFTPTFQAVIPEVLPDEGDYTRALSMSRLAYDLESLLSPVLAAALLTLVSYNWLFSGTALGFLASAALVLSAALPRPPTSAARSAYAARGVRAYAAATAGARLFLVTPRLRALLALNLTVAATGTTVMVNTIVYVREHLERPATDLPLALGAYGLGSMSVALLLPRVLERLADRAVMLPAAFAVTGVFVALAGLTAAGAGAWRWPALLATWAAFGAAGSLLLTPSGRLIRRSTTRANRTSAFAAQFSLSHGCWLLTYPLAGWLGATAGLQTAALTLGTLTLGSALLAARLWPADDGKPVEHLHPDLGPDHPHLATAQATSDGWRHSHAHVIVIDTLHSRWPTPTDPRANRFRANRPSARGD